MYQQCTCRYEFENIFWKEEPTVQENRQDVYRDDLVPRQEEMLMKMCFNITFKGKSTHTLLHAENCRSKNCHSGKCKEMIVYSVNLN